MTMPMPEPLQYATSAIPPPTAMRMIRRVFMLDWFFVCMRFRC